MSEQEKLKIFNEQGNQIGVATREEVHKSGYWHEAFHCWFVQKENDVHYVYLQLRSKDKKDYPNLLDITAAGHLLANETVEDGVREIKEEIGIDVSFDSITSLETIKYCATKENFIDNELAHVYMYQFNRSFDDFVLQKEEVSGMVRTELTNFYQLWLREIEEVRVEGFEIMEDGEKVLVDKMVTKEMFVPHEQEYYKMVLNLMIEKIKAK